MAQVFMDHFDADELDHGYRWYNEPAEDRWQLRAGRLMIMAARGQDLWGGLPLKRGAPILLRRPPVGDYEVRCLVDARWEPDLHAHQYINTQAGLFVFQDERNWLFLGFTNHAGQAGDLPQGDGLIVTSVIADESRIDAYRQFGPDTAKLRIVRTGHWWRFYYKTDRSWLSVAKLQCVLGTHEVGMGVKSFDSGGSPERAFFDDFELRVP